MNSTTEEESKPYDLSKTRSLTPTTITPPKSPNKYRRASNHISVLLDRARGHSGMTPTHRRTSPSAAQTPTFTKTYPCQPSVHCRIFIPRPERTRQSTVHHGGHLLPLYINVHGGGFMMGGPSLDDAFAAQLADRFGICVVSVGYRKAPGCRFPGPVEDVASLALSAIVDHGLPIDRKNVAIGGWDAGATLALAAAQTEELKEMVVGVVAVSPVVDWGIKVEDKVAGVEESVWDSSEKKGEGIGKRTKMDAKMYEKMRWAYVPRGHDTMDPLLSPAKAARSNLPPNVFLIGAQHDILCAEAENMAEGLAAVGVVDDGEYAPPRIGTENNWAQSGVRWMRIDGWTHGFHHAEEQISEREESRQLLVDNLIDEIGDWLRREVFVETESVATSPW